MHRRFAQVTESIRSSYKTLLKMEPVTTANLPNEMPKSGVYLFTDGSQHLYVGRSNRLRDRIRNHGSAASKHNVASFAFKIAREVTGNLRATYRSEGSRKHLLQQPKFARAFSDAKRRVSMMEVRFVEESDQLRQALLEIYVSVVLRTPFNDFDTH